ncbi:RNA polymerase subunit sigma-70 [Arthrobacter sp. MYb211]|uniref:sigma-70 family RNA polymerase sigma factor n=1 Tax=unclassified Arthrobacter TaxID=235627 RepID=UPI000CFB01D8|nr:MULTISPECIES: sigma-70 family RNA polymerase sigma factor [unclassified Arthrobacter]PRA10828.1 RNA polymerase subunit sigma-70 [Arthrobacter sp. MYb221]PRC06888.1 RNA polymerase subunit sigma-70 [Arthrobacter sp. MYb211]
MPLDAQVVSDIYREHGEALRRFALRVADNRDEAEDVVQETVLKVWKAAPVLTGSLRSYLFATARNVIIDRHRRAAARISALPLGETDPEAGDTSREISEALDRILMEEALMRLSFEHRKVVLHLHYFGSTVAQAARDLGIPEGTVKSRAYYAMRSLRGILEEIGVGQ